MTAQNPSCTATPHPEVLLVPADAHQVCCTGQPFAPGAQRVIGGGHPKVYYSFDGKDSVVCGYCDRLFTKTATPGAVDYVSP